MATQKQKQRIIDNLNQSFINLAMDNTKRDFEIFFDKTIAETLRTFPEDVTAKQIREVVNKIPIQRTTFLRQTYNMVALSGIINIVENQRILAADKKFLTPILPVIARYSVRNPDLLAKKIDQLSVAAITKNKSRLPKNDQSLFKNIDEYFNANERFISDELKENKVRLTRIHREIKSNISKIILKDLKREIRTRVTVLVERDGLTERVKRPQTFDEIRKKLRDKYGEQIDFRVRRIVDTEMHDLSEKSTFNHHLLMGYTHKKWNTQGDARVRDDKKANHVAMQGVTIPIKNKFRVAGGGTGLYPGDPQLPPRQRINCRCFLTFVRRS